MAYPASLETLPTNAANNTPAATEHPLRHNDLARIVNALQARVSFTPARIVNVLDHGAVAGNTGDQAAALTAAFDAVISGGSGGGTLYIPNGIYRYTTPMDWNALGGTVHILCESFSNTRLSWAGSTSAVALTMQRNHSYHVRNLNMINAGARGTTKGLQVTRTSGGTGTQSTNGYWQECAFDGWNHGLHFGNSPTAVAASECVVASCRWTNNDYGLWLEDANTLDFVVLEPSAGANGVFLATPASNQASSIQVIGGSGSANGIEFQVTCFQMSIDGYRSEVSGKFYEQAVSGGATSIILRGCSVLDMTGPTSVTQESGQLLLEGNVLHAPVSVKDLRSLVMIGNSVVDTVPFSVTSGTVPYTSLHNVGINTSGVVQSLFPNESGIATSSGRTPTWSQAALTGALTLLRPLQSSYEDFAEISAPGAPGANTARLYARDNGSGKTQLVAVFPTGVVQVLATEP